MENGSEPNLIGHWKRRKNCNVVCFRRRLDKEKLERIRSEQLLRCVSPLSLSINGSNF